jgi:hypothetical protein
MSSPKKICAINFWPRFSLETGFVKYLLDCAFDSFVVVATEKEADIILTSHFFKRQPIFKKRPAFPERTIAIIWENMRPNYELYRYSISSDFDSYGGRNCRVPLWYAQLNWPGIVPDQMEPMRQYNHGFEPLVDIDSLLRPRRRSQERNLFCCFVANNPELHRMLCLERLSSIGRVDIFGNVAGKPLRASKYETLSHYRFNLCFENSIFPGYYTEKPLQAWAGGCVPLYFSDRWFSRDFNTKAFINRIDFSTLDDFVRHVAYVNQSESALAELLDQPLLTKRPTLDSAVDFLRQACSETMTISPQERRRWGGWLRDSALSR